MKNYLAERLQKVRRINNFNNWEEITCAVVKSSVLGSLLFNIVLNGNFLYVEI